MNFRDLHHATEDIQAALDAHEIQLGTAEACVIVLDAVDDLLRAEATLRSESDELRQNLWDQSAELDRLKKELDNRPRTSDELERVRAELAELRTTTDAKIANQAHTIQSLARIKEFREAQLSSMAVILKACQ